MCIRDSLTPICRLPAIGVWTAYRHLAVARDGQEQAEHAFCRAHEVTAKNLAEIAARSFGELGRVHRTDLPSRQLTVGCTCPALAPEQLAACDRERIAGRRHGAIAAVHGLVYLVATSRTGASDGRALGNEQQVLDAIAEVEQYCRDARAALQPVVDLRRGQVSA